MKFFRAVETTEKEFRVSIYVLIYEFILGLFELAAGLTIALFGSRIYAVYQTSLIRELSEDPNDLLAHLSETFVPGLLTHNALVILYLIIFGLAKIAGAIGLIYKQNWGVDLLVGLIIVMAPFQLYEFITRPNFLGLLYLIGSLLIALYLVEFRPGAWISRMLRFRR